MPAIKIPKEFYCFLSGKIMREPVVFLGHHYEKDVLLEWFSKNDIDPATQQILHGNKKFYRLEKTKILIEKLQLCEKHEFEQVVIKGDVQALKNLNYPEEWIHSIYTPPGIVKKAWCTYLHYIISKNYYAMVELFIQENANIHSFDEFNRTPLHEAALYGHKEILQLLLARGAFLEARDRDGNTPLHFAIYHSSHQPITEEKLASIALLLENGANIRAKNILGHMPVQTKHNQISEMMRKYDRIWLTEKIELLEKQLSEKVETLSLRLQQIESQPKTLPVTKINKTLNFF